MFETYLNSKWLKTAILVTELLLLENFTFDDFCIPE